MMKIRPFKYFELVLSSPKGTLMEKGRLHTAIVQSTTHITRKHHGHGIKHFEHGFGGLSAGEDFGTIRMIFGDINETSA